MLGLAGFRTVRMLSDLPKRVWWTEGRRACRPTLLVVLAAARRGDLCGDARRDAGRMSAMTAVADMEVDRHDGRRASAPGPSTHPGAKRERNEDTYVDRPDLGLWAVADGAGGHAAGEVASGMIAEALEAIPAGSARRRNCWRKCGWRSAHARRVARKPLGAVRM